MAAEDFYQAIPPPDLSPEALGVPPLPPLNLPALAPPQLGMSPDDKQKRQWTALLGAIAAGVLGPGRGTGIAQGLSGEFASQDQEKHQLDQLALQQYDHAATIQQQQQHAYDTEQQRREMEGQRRGQQLTSTLGNLKTDLLKAKTKDQADQLLTMYGAALSGSGFRGYDANGLATKGYRWVQPSAEQRASDHFDKLMSNPLTQETLKQDPTKILQSVVQFDANNDGVPESYTFADFAKLAGRPIFTDQNQQPMVAPKSANLKMDTPFEASLNTAVAKFKADNHRDPTAAEQQTLVQQSVKDAKAPEDPQMAELFKQGRVLNNALISQNLSDKKNTPNQRDVARSDRGYQQANTDLNNLRKPIADQAERLSRLVESVNQQTPQADALIAPELLTVMAGGAGSGLRMNEAEISRIVGGRSNFESIKASLNKWQSDPTKALSITPAQRQQIKRLIDAVAARSASKMDVLDKATQDIIDAPDVETQRRIVAGVKRALTQSTIGSPSAAPAGVEEWVRDPATGKLMKRGAQ